MTATNKALEHLKDRIRRKECARTKSDRTWTAAALVFARRAAVQGSRRRRVLRAISHRWAWRGDTAEAVGLIMFSEICDGTVIQGGLIIRRGSGNKALRRWARKFAPNTNFFVGYPALAESYYKLLRRTEARKPELTT